MYSTPFLLRVLGLLGLLLGLLGLLSVCSLKAQLHFATNSERPNFARLCAFRLGNRRPKAFLFAPQAKKILLFAFAKQDPTCLLVVVHCKVVSTLDKKKNQIPPDQAKEGLLAIIRDKRRDDLAAAAISLRPGDLARWQLSIHRRLFGISVVLLACVPLL